MPYIAVISSAIATLLWTIVTELNTWGIKWIVKGDEIKGQICLDSAMWFAIPAAVMTALSIGTIIFAIKELVARN
jgi:hypothetical protein